MAVFSTAMLAVASLVGNVAADAAGTFSMPIARSQPRQGLPLGKRSPTAVSLGNNVTYGLYYVNASVGTPAQTVELQLDTGSSDVWLFSPQACAEAECTGGTFDPTKSSTYKQDNALPEFQIQYVTPGSGVNGTYFTDNLSMGNGNLKLTNLIMALAQQAAAVNSGIMGVGFAADESLASNTYTGQTYPSIIDTMVNESVISSHSYSLWLDDLEASTGTILFGGYDTDKYSGPITVLDIQPDAQSGDITSFTVAWSLLALTDPTGTYAIQGNWPYAAVLDSGTTLMAVPTEIYQPIAVYFGVQNSREYGPIFSCKHVNWPGTLDFQFAGAGGPIIQVPFAELGFPLGTNSRGQPITLSNGDEACVFGLQPSPEEGIYLLGDTFLRSAYVVYDMDAEQVAIAQTNFNSTKSNVQSIVSGKKLQSILPSASYATGAAVTVTGTNTQIPGFGTYTNTGGIQTATSVRGSGSLSHVAGVKTTLPLSSLSNVPSNTATGASGGSGTAATTSSTRTSTANAAPGVLRPSGGDSGVFYTLLTAMVMVGAGAAMFITF